MTKLEELTQQKRQKEAEIESRKREMRRAGHRITSRRNRVGGAEAAANALLQSLLEDLRRINRDIEVARREIRR
jgi:chromosome segregation ATPase